MGLSVVLVAASVEISAIPHDTVYVTQVLKVISRSDKYTLIAYAHGRSVIILVECHFSEYSALSMHDHSPDPYPTFYRLQTCSASLR